MKSEVFDPKTQILEPVMVIGGNSGPYPDHHYIFVEQRDIRFIRVNLLETERTV